MKISQKTMELVEKEQKCIGCNACMKGCPMLDEFCNSPKELLKQLKEAKTFDYKLPYSCMLCGYCTKVCPEGVDLKGLFLELRRDAVDQTGGKLPKDLNTSKVDMHQRLSFSKWFSTDVENIQSEWVFFPGCALMAYSPKVVENTYAYLRKKIEGIGIYNKCCGKPTRFLGKEKQFNEYFSKLEKEFEDKGVKKVVTACQNCFMTLSQNSSIVEAISLWEVLATVGIPKEKEGIGEKLGYDVTLHDPCPTRDVTVIQDSVRKIISELGIDVKEMKFNKGRTLCCGSGAMVGVTQSHIADKHTKRRAKEADTEYIITYCQECVESMRRGGKKSFHLLDILFNDDFDNMKQENNSTLNKWVNRYRGKYIGKKVK